ncbi:hypothetical protein CVV67_08555 [Arthrobacter stackebrandtii]|nr:hypothetical protein CVV67_08555 [Arthrobacter stackebrandtii]
MPGRAGACRPARHTGGLKNPWEQKVSGELRTKGQGMDNVRRAGLCILAAGAALMVAMAILMAVSRTMDPNGVPIVPAMFLAWGGLVAVTGLATLLVGVFGKKSRI